MTGFNLVIRVVVVSGALLVQLLTATGAIEGAHRQTAEQRPRVRLCTSVPLAFVGRKAISQGVDNSVVLATAKWKARFSARHLSLLQPLMLNDGMVDGSPSVKLGVQNARECVSRVDTFGMVGPLQSPLAAASEPILNRAGMVQVSPANTSILLTSRLARSTEQPATSRHRLRYVTYYRDITTDAMQGPSDAAYLKKKLHASTYFAVDDGVTYSAGLIGIMEKYSAKLGLRLVGSGHIDPTSATTVSSSAEAMADLIAAQRPGGVLYAADSYGALLPKLLRSKGYNGPLVAGDAIFDPSFIAAAGTASRKVFSSRAGPDVSATSRPFRRAYRQRFHVPLQEFDALAYDAANIELNAIYMAAIHHKMHGTLFSMRAAVLPYVAHVRWHGAIGPTSFDKNGDNRNRIVEMYGVRNNTWVYLGRAPSVGGVSPAG